ncbi:hypothetical protein QMP26_41585 (plasmid) [Enterocloster clostridioformis]
MDIHLAGAIGAVHEAQSRGGAVCLVRVFARVTRPGLHIIAGSVMRQMVFAQAPGFLWTSSAIAAPGSYAISSMAHSSKARGRLCFLYLIFFYSNYSTQPLTA